MKVYLAGPMRGIPNLNAEAFNDATEVLRNHGYEVFNPLDGEDLTAEVQPLAHYMEKDLAALCKCEAICMLDGWEKSQGATLEHEVARRLGLNLMRYAPHAPDCMMPLHLGPESASGVHPAPLDMVYKTYTFPSQQAIIDEDPGHCPHCGEPYEIVWPGKSQPRCDCYDDDLNPHTEVRVTDPETGGQKCSKLARFDLISQEALWALAEHYGRGAEKYDDNNWRKGYKWSLTFAACLRHLSAFWSGEDRDPETGSLHVTAAAWHCFTMITFILLGLGTDDRLRTD